MSCNQWESGTIQLPTAEFARVRQAVQDADQAAKERTFQRAQTFWKGLSRKEQTDVDAYRAAVNRHLWRERENRPFPSHLEPLSDAIARGDLQDALERCSRSRWDPATRTMVPAKIRRVQKADMNFPTNRTTSFSASGDATITFDKAASSVTFSNEGNRSQDWAKADPRTVALLGALDKVRWTRGTGGLWTGNDEYNEEAGRDNPGGGGSYVTQGFGPVGAAHPEAWNRTESYRDSTGRLVRTEGFPGRKQFERQIAAQYGGSQGRRPKGAPRSTGGQFTGQARGETGFWF